jgi:hypothetical protein
MQFKKALFLIVISSFFIAGCGENNKEIGKVRFLNAIPDVAEFTFFLNDSDEIILRYGEISPYYKLNSEETNVVRVFVPGGSVPIYQNSFSVRTEIDRTIAFAGPKQLEGPQERYIVSMVTLNDLHEPQIGNRSLLRVVHLAPSADPLDVVITNSEAIEGAVLPRYEQLTFRSSTNYFQAEAEIRQTVITLESSTTGATVYRSPELNLQSNAVLTFYVLDRPLRGTPVTILTSMDSDF